MVKHMGFEPLRLLYLDDEPDALKGFKILFKMDFSVFTCNSCKETVEFLEKEQVDVLITDQMMPDMLGTVFLESIKGKYLHMGRILLTGYSEKERVHEAIEKKIVHSIVSKPFEYEILKDAVFSVANKLKTNEAV